MSAFKRTFRRDEKPRSGEMFIASVPLLFAFEFSEMRQAFR